MYACMAIGLEQRWCCCFHSFYFYDSRILSVLRRKRENPVQMDAAFMKRLNGVESVFLGIMIHQYFS
jgi:hypothetical protein